jgi:hypothetical protein
MTRRIQLTLSLFAAGALAVGACSKTDSPPTAFGVNVTVDASMLSSAQRAKITKGKLSVTSDKAPTPVLSDINDLHNAIQGGTVRFHYKPVAGTTKDEKLTLTLDALNGTDVVATGTAGPIPLADNAVTAMITLKASGDGGVPNDGQNMDVNQGEVVNPLGKDNGAACTMDGECSRGFCTDGVCCNERCDDICVSCNQTATKGTCTPYAANTDPEMQCGAKLPPTDVDAGSSDAGEAGAPDGAAADASESDAPVINIPDGGLMTTPTMCGGSCSGARSCSYPGTTKSCGTAFCNTEGQAASFVCDGNGGCAPALTDCKDFKCVDATGTCGTQCTVTSDCLSSDFCGGDKKCTTKKGNGVPCVTPDECSSGNCIAGPTGGVCCNTACDSPLTCTMAGAVGQCKCSECPNGTCQVFYPDTDGDGFGDRTASYAAHTAKAACTGMAPVGFVADNTDCDDGDSMVHPGQTGWFATKSRNGAGTFDYNCDGVLTKKTPEYPGGSCKFCGSVGACSLVSVTCGAANQASAFQCPQEYYNPIIQKLSGNTDVSITPIPGPDGLESRAAGAGVPIIQPIPGRYECCGCLANDKTGFLGTVACGASSTTYTCNPCAGMSQGPATATATTGVIQNCH